MFSSVCYIYFLFSYIAVYVCMNSIECFTVISSRFNCTTIELALTNLHLIMVNIACFQHNYTMNMSWNYCRYTSKIQCKSSRFFMEPLWNPRVKMGQIHSVTTVHLRWVYKVSTVYTLETQGCEGTYFVLLIYLFI